MLKVKVPVIFPARRVFRHAGMDVIRFVPSSLLSASLAAQAISRFRSLRVSFNS
jgi:hypothetical protein